MTTAVRTRPAPDHGTGTRYGRGCRCRRCTDAAVKEDQMRVLDRLRGRPRTLPTAPVIDHLKQLRDNGMSWDEIGRAAGTSASTAREIHDGKQSRVMRATAAKLLAVPLTHQATELGFTPALGATRRVRALYAIGCTRYNIAAAAGLSEYTITLIAAGKWATLALHHDQGIRRAYGAMWTQPGKSAKNRIRARREGWASPLGWDDIDDPDEVPSMPVVEEGPVVGRAARLAQAEARSAEIEHLASFGISPGDIAERTGLSVGYVRAQLDGSRAPGWREKASA